MSAPVTRHPKPTIPPRGRLITPRAIEAARILIRPEPTMPIVAMVASAAALLASAASVQEVAR